MRPDPDVPQPQIRYQPNDPMASHEPSRLVAAPADLSPPRVRVIPEGAQAPPPAIYPEHSAPYRYWQLRAALARTLATWHAVFPEWQRWQGGRAEITADPNGGEDLNAFYDRAGLVFFERFDPELHRAVHAAESVDVVAHECSHAVLDALRPDLWDAASFEAAAVHEAFGDIGAVLVAVGDSAVLQAALDQVGGNLRLPSAVSRLAEEFGKAARDIYGPAAGDGLSLRDAANDFRYLPPSQLPPSAPASELSREPHSFSRVWSGLFFRAMVEGAPGATVAELQRSATALSGALVRALRAVPLRADWYARVAQAWLREIPAGPERAAAAAEVERREISAHAWAAGQEHLEFLSDLRLHRRLEHPATGLAPGRRATHRLEPGGSLRRLRVF